MKTKKMNPKNKRLSSGVQKKAKRSIHTKGSWKAVELDPSIFSEEGLEGLVCFEELTDYRLVDSEKAVAEAAKELKKKEKKKEKMKEKMEKRKANKRKAREAGEAGEKVDVESKDEGTTAEPAKKKKKKKNKKPATKETAQPDDTSAEVTQEDVAAGEDGEKDEAKEDTAVNSESDAQSKPTKKTNKKQKQKQQQQIQKVLEEQPNQESPSEPQAQEEEKSTQDKVTKPPKKQQKNWTNAALSGSNDKNADVTAWKDLFVPSPVLKALSSLGFGSPTPIQALALPSAIRDRMDILGAAETGKIKDLFALLSSNNLHCVKTLHE